MARHEVVTYDVICDVCKNQVPEEDRKPSVSLDWGGAKYKIDLCVAHQDEFTYIVDQVEVYASAGVKVTGSQSERTSNNGNARSAPTGGSGRGREELQKIREWANSNGEKVGDRGRIPQRIIDLYNGRPFDEGSESPKTVGAIAPKKRTRKPIMVGAGIPVQ